MIFLSSTSIAEVTSGTIFLIAGPGSYIGGGIGASQVLWTHGDEGVFTIETNPDKGASVKFDDGKNWRFDFAAPTFNTETSEDNSGNLLEVKLYEEATRYPFNSATKPGLNFSGNGRGNNTSSGSFNVLEIEYNDENEIERLAVDFIQYDESEDSTGTNSFGSLRINSTIPTNTSGNVSGGGDAEIPTASYTVETRILSLPVVIVNGTNVSARLLFEQVGNETQFVLQEAAATEETSDNAALFAADTGTLTVPVIEIFQNESQTNAVFATLTVIEGADPLRFLLVKTGTIGELNRPLVPHKS